MRIIKWLVALSCFAPFAARAGDTPQSYDQFYSIAGEYHYVQNMIDLNQFLGMMNDPNAVIVDLRGRAAYEQSHIQGAIMLHANASEAEIKEHIPKGSSILLYNANSFDPASMAKDTDLLAPQMTAYGYKKIYMLAPVWKNNPHYQEDLKKLPMTAGAAPVKSVRDPYASCMTDHDCILVEDVCPGSFRGINKKYKEEQAALVNRTRPLIKCGSPHYDRAPAPSVCTNNMCEVSP